jgi:hypothetical protein
MKTIGYLIPVIWIKHNNITTPANPFIVVIPVFVFGYVCRADLVLENWLTTTVRSSIFMGSWFLSLRAEYNLQVFENKVAEKYEEFS